MHRTGWGRRRPDRCWRCVYVPERWGGRPRAGRSRSVTRGGRRSGSPWPSGRIWMVVPAAGAHRAPEVAKGVLKEVQRSMGEWRFENHHEIAVVAPAGFEPVFEANLAWAKSQTPLSRRSAPWVQEVLAPDEALYEVLESRNAIVFVSRIALARAPTGRRARCGGP